MLIQSLPKCYIYATYISGQPLPKNAEVIAFNATVHTPAPVRVNISLDQPTGEWWIVSECAHPEHVFYVLLADLTHISAFVKMEMK
jgi:hypothetical protein